MAWNLPSDRDYQVSAYVKTSGYSDAEDVWGQLHQAVRDYTHYDFEEKNTFSTYSDEKVFKVTITIERQ